VIRGAVLLVINTPSEFRRLRRLFRGAEHTHKTVLAELLCFLQDTEWKIFIITLTLGIR